MSMTDPIADFLTRIRNSIGARREKASIPASKLKLRIAEILKQEGYIRDYRLVEDNRQGILEIELKYDDQHRSAIEGLRRMSKPGQRHYVGKNELPKVRNGLGVAILTTSRGVLTDKEARRQSVGGEVVCAVW
ncbi:MAG: 30S ribosomal protein S8 [Deltaproteobacteria bacterium]|nr:30S ribosomal protein S8 [Deltaproteobacteria bacterium]